MSTHQNASNTPSGGPPRKKQYVVPAPGDLGGTTVKMDTEFDQNNYETTPPEAIPLFASFATLIEQVHRLDLHLNYEAKEEVAAAAVAGAADAGAGVGENVGPNTTMHNFGVAGQGAVTEKSSSDEKTPLSSNRICSLSLFEGVDWDEEISKYQHGCELMGAHYQDLDDFSSLIGNSLC